MDFTTCGEELLANAGVWIDKSKVLTREQLRSRFVYELNDIQKMRLKMLLETYRRFPTQTNFFHGYLFYVVGESLFRDFVRFANSLSNLPTLPSTRSS